MKYPLLLLLVLAGQSFSASGDQLVIPLNSEHRRCDDTDCPSRGMTMTLVKSRYGEPRQIHPAVGEPPISRWVYENFSVYFENSRVIHAVGRR